MKEHWFPSTSFALAGELEAVCEAGARWLEEVEDGHVGTAFDRYAY